MTTKTKPQRSWTDDEIAFVLSNPDKTSKAIAAELGRSFSGTRSMRSKLANGRPPVPLKRGHGGNNRFWTDTETSILIDRADLTYSELAEMLGRSVASVENKARSARAGEVSSMPGWTQDEDDVLRDLSSSNSSAQIAAAIPGRSAAAVKIRRRTLGLPHAPVGDVYSPYKPGPRTLLARTCRKCGLLMPGEKFGLVKRGGEHLGRCIFCGTDDSKKWQSDNPEKVKAYVTSVGRKNADKWRRKIDELTRESATRSGYPYLEEDFEVLEDPQLSILGKALKLKRTYTAVQQACASRELPSLGRFISSRTDSAWIIDNPNAGQVDEITAALKQEFTTAGIPFPEWDWDD